MICDIRIDDRLIHGQVVGYWVPQYNLDKIVVVDDEIVKDKDRKNALRFGCPENVSLSFHSAKKTAEILKTKGDGEHRVMLLARSPKALLDMVCAGFPMQRITVGNMSPHDESDKHIKGTTYVSDDDIHAFKELIQKGVEVIVQFKPGDRPENINSFFNDK